MPVSRSQNTIVLYCAPRPKVIKILLSIPVAALFTFSKKLEFQMEEKIKNTGTILSENSWYDRKITLIIDPFIVFLMPDTFEIVPGGARRETPFDA